MLKLKLSRFLNLLISIILLVANSLTITHHHKDGKHHTDCQVCVLQLNQQSEDPNSLEFSHEIQTFNQDFPIIFRTLILKSQKTSNKNPRAPPVLA
jgi:hypothetical protein